MGYVTITTPLFVGDFSFIWEDLIEPTSILNMTALT